MMRRGRGFTMIELMIVITIMSLLMALLAPTLRHAIETARRNQCRANLALMGTVLNLYAASNNKEFPPQYVPANTYFGAVPHAMQYGPAVSAQQSVAVYQVLRESYGMDERILQCPTRSEGLWIEPTDDPGFGNPTWLNCVLTSYTWTYGLNPAPNAVGVPTSVTTSPMGRRYDNGQFILAADLAMETHYGSTGSGPAADAPMIYNHDTEGEFAGGNVLTVAGTVEWLDKDAWLTRADSTVDTQFTPGASGNGTFYHGWDHTWWWPAYSVAE